MPRALGPPLRVHCGCGCRSIHAVVGVRDALCALGAPVPASAKQGVQLTGGCGAAWPALGRLGSLRYRCFARSAFFLAL